MNTVAKQCHVYQITNKLNGMQYIGVTYDPHRRFAGHSRNTDVRVKSYVNSAILKYGKDNFEFKILLTGERQYCMEMEASIIKTFNTVAPNGYNISGGNDGPIAGRSGHKNPMYGKTGEKSPLWGRKQPEYVKTLISECRKGSKNPMYGMSAELSPCSKEFIAIDPSGNEYTGKGLNSFSKKHNLLPSGMRSVANGRRNHHKGWKVSYVQPHIRMVS